MLRRKISSGNTDAIRKHVHGMALVVAAVDNLSIRDESVSRR